jgi:flagellar hook assembly protein FlgD
MTFTPTPTPYVGLIKTASSVRLSALDNVVYQVYFTNFGTGSVGPVTLVDSLPTTLAETYMTGSAAPSAAFDPTANTLTWVVPSLGPGASVTVNYAMAVALTGSQFNPIVNNAQLSYSGGTVNTSAAVSVVGDYVIKLAVYNSAGEKVKDLATFEIGADISNFQIVGQTITTENGVAQFFYNGHLMTSWDATDTQGQKVANGTYFVKIDSTTPFGSTTSITQNIYVNIVRSTMLVTIYNQAGEAVRTFTTEQIESQMAGGVYQPSDLNLGLMQLSGQVFTPSYQNPTAPGNRLIITLGSGNTLAWDGTNDAGVIVDSGIYFVEIQSNVPDKSNQQVVRQVRVLNPHQGPGTGVVLVPNPIHLSQTTQAQFQIGLNSSQVTGTQVKIYTIAGEWIQTLPNLPGNPGLVNWDLSNGLASGTYLAVVEVLIGDSVLQRQILKVAILH